jgi:hypothetical protein
MIRAGQGAARSRPADTPAGAAPPNPGEERTAQPWHRLAKETGMLSLTDCLDFIDLDRETIEIIAEHQHMSQVLATELGNHLVANRRGLLVIHDMHRDLIEAAAARGNLTRERELRQIYTRFSRKYPMPRGAL